jgi:hypothetical protein
LDPLIGLGAKLLLPLGQAAVAVTLQPCARLRLDPREGRLDLGVRLRLQSAHLGVELLPVACAAPGVGNRDPVGRSGLGLLEAALQLLEGPGGALPLPLEILLERLDLGGRPLLCLPPGGFHGVLHPLVPLAVRGFGGRRARRAALLTGPGAFIWALGHRGGHFTPAPADRGRRPLRLSAETFAFGHTAVRSRSLRTASLAENEPRRFFDARTRRPS